MVIGMISEEEGRRWLLKVKDALEQDGFTTSFNCPEFFRYHHNPGYALFVDEPIPQLVPNQKHTIALSGDGYFHILVNFYFPEFDRDDLEADDYERIFREIDDIWIVRLEEFFGDIAYKFDLDRDVEEDDEVDYSLIGNFPLASPEKIVSLLKEIRKIRIAWEKT